MPAERLTFRMAVFVILVKDGQVLLHRRQNTTWYDGHYDMPSGHLEDGESLVEAACREAWEEARVTIEPRHVKFVSALHTKYDMQYVNFVFEVKSWEGEPQIGEPDSCDDIRWFPLDDLPDKITPSSRDSLDTYKSKVPFAEIGF